MSKDNKQDDKLKKALDEMRELAKRGRAKTADNDKPQRSNKTK